MSAERKDLRLKLDPDTHPQTLVRYRMSVPAEGPIALACWLRQAAQWVEANTMKLQPGTTTHLGCTKPRATGTLYVEPGT